MIAPDRKNEVREERARSSRKTGDNSGGRWLGLLILAPIALVPLHLVFPDIFLLKLAANLAVLFTGAVLLIMWSNWVSGMGTRFLHIGWLTIIVLVGTALFFKFGWVSTFAVLGVTALWGTIGGFFDRWSARL